MQIPRRPAQTRPLNSLALHSLLINGCVIFGVISPWWLLLGIPGAMMAFTAESNLKPNEFN